MSNSFRVSRAAASLPTALGLIKLPCHRVNDTRALHDTPRSNVLPRP